MKTFLSILALATATSIGYAQTPLLGDWNGSLNVGGMTLKLIFHVKHQNGQLSATMDSPDQGVYGLTASDAFASDDSISIGVEQLKIRYTGKLNGQKITGTFQQGMAKLPMTLGRGGNVAQANRPQTPKAPFPYQSEDLSFHNKDNSIQYGATLTIPAGNGPFPAVLLITGSGSQNRDEELFSHKPFAVIADHLTRNGYAVLRVDDRGTGKTTGTFKGSTTEDFVQDAAAAFDYLKSRKEVNARKLGVLGHSEGGLIAEILTSRRNDISFAVLMAAPGINSVQLMTEQNKAAFASTKLPDEVINSYATLYTNIANSAAKTSDSLTLANDISQFVQSWVKNTDASTVATTTGITEEATMKKVINTFSTSFSDAWIRHFLRQDPQAYLPNIKAKVLAINGSKDIQVISTSNLEGIKNGLSKGKNKNVEIKELQGLNHLFQTCKTCTPQEYGQLEETIAPIVLETITNWLNKEVK